MNIKCINNNNNNNKHLYSAINLVNYSKALSKNNNNYIYRVYDGSFLVFFRALLGADVVLLLGARLNWIMHFGTPPRYAENTKYIQVSSAWKVMFKLKNLLLDLCQSMVYTNF